MAYKPRALILFSGGLDSILAARLVLDQGCELQGVNFYTTFTGDDPALFSSANDQKSIDLKPASSAHLAAKELGMPLLNLDLTKAFSEILQHPKYGFGVAMNPCLDCKLFFIQKAYKLMQDLQLDFLVTGEVVGQRPMSQRKDTLPLAIPLTSNRIVRPLSAKLLPISYPEEVGWLDRNKLLGISGRRREEQLALAKQLGLKYVPQPAGGCLLTDAAFSNRLRDFLKRFPSSSYDAATLQLLKVGRHLALSDTLKVIVGKTAAENSWLQQHKLVRFWAEIADYPGATVVLQPSDAFKDLPPDVLNLVAKLAVHFSKARDQIASTPCKVHFYNRRSLILTLPVTKALDPATLSQWYL